MTEKSHKERTNRGNQMTKKFQELQTIACGLVVGQTSQFFWVFFFPFSFFKYPTKH